MELSSSNCKFINFLFNINRIYNTIQSGEIQTSSNKSKSLDSNNNNFQNDISNIINLIILFNFEE